MNEEISDFRFAICDLAVPPAPVQLNTRWPAQPGLHHDCGVDAGPGHRDQHGHLKFANLL
jgi:hypothetical protein